MPTMLRHKETQDNLNDEYKVKDIIMNKWKVKLHKLPIQYKLDYALTRFDKSILAFCEIKVRTNSIGSYPTYIVSLAKILSGRNLARETNTKSFLIVKWSDSLGFIDMENNFKTIVGGRIDRNDWQDIEPMCEFNINNFQRIYNE